MVVDGIYGHWLYIFRLVLRNVLSLLNHHLLILICFLFLAKYSQFMAFHWDTPPPNALNSVYRVDRIPRPNGNTTGSEGGSIGMLMVNQFYYSESYSKSFQD